LLICSLNALITVQCVNPVILIKIEQSFMLRKTALNFSLANEQDSPQTIHDNIMSGIVFKGTNLWILMVAIVIASVGLNVNSTAVIIGAMLISPLMGPIIGIGYGLGTYDFDLVRQSIKNYLLAVVIGLIVSTLYFSISPINEAHSELLARTTPTIYDVLIAFFGGLAGFIAIVSRYKGNVITGVAIATALMPPLCTAGYGLASQQFNFVSGALYLLAINTVFIALAALITTRLFGQPLIQQANNEQKKQANRYVTFIVVLTLIPSIYLGISFIRQDQFQRKAKNLVSTIKLDNNYLLKYEVLPAHKIINLTFGGMGLSTEQTQVLQQQATALGLETKINIQQGFSFSQLGDINSQTELLRKEVNHLREDLTKLAQAEQQRNTLEVNLVNSLLTELNVFYPEITSVELGNISESTISQGTIQFVVIRTQSPIVKQTLSPKIIQSWLKKRLKQDKIIVVFNPSL
jgi:uncharacterized hydrophobic protein (TIGR00271 family)